MLQVSVTASRLPAGVGQPVQADEGRGAVDPAPHDLVPRDGVGGVPEPRRELVVRVVSERPLAVERVGATDRQRNAVHHDGIAFGDLLQLSQAVAGGVAENWRWGQRLLESGQFEAPRSQTLLIDVRIVCNVAVDVVRQACEGVHSTGLSRNEPPREPGLGIPIIRF